MEISEYMGKKRQLLFTAESQILNVEGVSETEIHPKNPIILIAVGKTYGWSSNYWAIL